MSKVGNALKMLLLLKSRGKMKIQEIADELEVNKRNISIYKDDLEQAGIYIISTAGRYGGYEIDSVDYLSSLYLTSDEYNSLIFGVEHLRQYNSPYFLSLKAVSDKITALKKLECTKTFENVYYIKNTKSNCDIGKERKYWLDINAAIITLNKIKIIYESASNEVTDRIIDPYAVFQYDSSFYVEGYSEELKEYRIFKLNRIIELVELKEKYRKQDDYNLKERMKECFGIYKDDVIDIELKIYYPIAHVIKEKIWVENQKITECRGDNCIIFNAKMRGKTQIKSWILSMGKDVEVLKPQSIKTEILEELKEMIKNYK